nr:hypothetical protein Iba_chr10dCG14870 [Ipomoea batatas]
MKARRHHLTDPSPLTGSVNPKPGQRTTRFREEKRLADNCERIILYIPEPDELCFVIRNALPQTIRSFALWSIGSRFIRRGTLSGNGDKSVKLSKKAASVEATDRGSSSRFLTPDKRNTVLVTPFPLPELLRGHRHPLSAAHSGANQRDEFLLWRGLKERRRKRID